MIFDMAANTYKEMENDFIKMKNDLFTIRYDNGILTQWPVDHSIDENSIIVGKDDKLLFLK